MCHNPDMLSAIEKQCFLLDTKIIKQFSPETMSFFEFENVVQFSVAKRISSAGPLIGSKTEIWIPEPYLEFSFNAHQETLPFRRDGKGLPLIEGKMISQYDLFFSAWNEDKAEFITTAGSSTQVLHSKYSIDEKAAIANLAGRKISSGSADYDYKKYRIGFRDVARSNDERTAIATIIPPNVFCVETVKNIRPLPPLQLLYTIGVWNSYIFDFYARLKIDKHFNFHDIITFPLPRPSDNDKLFLAIGWRVNRLISVTDYFERLWQDVLNTIPITMRVAELHQSFIATYGPAHEQEIRKRLRDEAESLTPEWGPHCGVHDRLPDRRDTGDRAQLRAEIDAYVAHLYGLSRDDFAYILDTFPVLKNKEKKAFGEFMSKRKCLEEYDRIGKVLGK
jgi:hypothetical protein